MHSKPSHATFSMVELGRHRSFRASGLTITQAEPKSWHRLRAYVTTQGPIWFRCWVCSNRGRIAKTLIRSFWPSDLAQISRWEKWSSWPCRQYLRACSCSAFMASEQFLGSTSRAGGLTNSLNPGPHPAQALRSGEPGVAPAGGGFVQADNCPPARRGMNRRQAKSHESP